MVYNCSRVAYVSNHEISMDKEEQSVFKLLL